MGLSHAIGQLFELLEFILILRILLSWFPNISWWKQPFKLLNDITEPILTPFRRMIPPINGLDLSPIFAFLSLEIIKTILMTLTARF